MFCGNCGKELREGTKFCPNCGTLQTSAVPPQQDPLGVPQQEDLSPQQPAQSWQQDFLEQQTSVEQQVPETSDKPSAVRGTESTAKRVLRIILSVFLSLILFMFSFSALLTADVRMTFTEDSISQLLSDVSMEDIPLETILADELEDYDEVTDWLEDVIYEETQVLANISEQKLDRFLEKSSVLPFLSEKLSAYTDSIFSGSYREEIDKDEIEELVMDNADLLKEVFDVVVLEKDAERIADWFETSGTLDSLSLRELSKDDEVESTLNLIHLLFSYITLGVMIALSVLMVVLLFVVNKKKINSALCFVGVPLFISGGLLSLLNPVTALLPAEVYGIGLVGKMAHSVFSAGWIPSLSVLAVGFVAMVCGIVLKKIQRT